VWRVEAIERAEWDRMTFLAMTIRRSAGDSESSFQEMHPMDEEEDDADFSNSDC